MSQLSEDRKKQIESAAQNLETILRRIAPFIRRPVEEPKKHQTWVSSGSGIKIKNLQQK